MLTEICKKKYNKTIKECSNEEIYFALLDMTKELAEDKVTEDGKKKVYYISAEFLIGKLLSNNLINLGIFDEVKQVLAENGKSIYDIEEVEPEPFLGNGGLGEQDVSPDFTYIDRIVEYATKEMTIEEIENKLGHKVKIVNKK